MEEWGWEQSRMDWNQRGQKKKELAAGFHAWSETESANETKREQDLIQRNLPLASVSNILDFGCGVGRMTKWLQGCFPSAEYIGVDFALEMLKVAKEANKDVRYQRIELSIPFGASSFGAFFTATVLRHIVVEKEILNTVSELSRILKQDGIAILFENIEQGREPLNPLHVLFRKPEEYIAMFSKHGIILEEKDSEVFHGQRHAVFVGRKQ